jgi:hypothetical protein
MALILPDHLKIKHRPYATAPLDALLLELQHRRVLITISAEQHCNPGDEVRQATLMGMFAQLAEALRGSDIPIITETPEAEGTWLRIILNLIRLPHDNQ